MTRDETDQTIKIAYYPGCTLKGTTKEFGDSIELSFSALGIELIEIPSWICCGATSAHATDKNLAIALPYHNFAKTQEMGMGTIAIPCAACFQRHKVTNKECEREDIRKEMYKITGHRYDGNIRCRHPLEVLMKDIKPEKWQNLLKKKLGLKAACYYGCLLTRPEDVMEFDERPENPQLMDDFCETLGMKTVDWNYKVTCCGASYFASKPEIVLKLTSKILEDAKKSGAECVVVACPLCHSNLDMKQKEIGKELRMDLDMPVFYFSQLLGLALGIDHRKLGLHTHFVDTQVLLDRKRLI
ncbi:heterodisulfide reductase subunit B [Candidatus Woesearchaeota archaeon CG11_big_fil_rev_8_21_14_0_20_43_8]|nr:MAG: heterodisulfide reductase subunit B [Candidatus Woesearchaeota archaeon CG11_big_fil_rev_8_21_14_0_20_43_8]PIO09014.1 MAG: heterodisulfide reductase subunit B [Candidatus Woesearchaeota archaeon CG08_land_8_20_14_0_20_43_7]